MEKITKKEMYAKLRAKVENDADLCAFIDHEVELLTKKNSAKKKPTKNQVENVGIKETILNALTETPTSITDLMANCVELDNLSNQRVSALMTQLVDENKVVRIVEKRKALFYKA
ncbi:MAG: hypothetical protein KBT30_00605 [Clostridiales bacterium]|nr:hypothetical protein [Candidatus Apopatousia equi]